MGAPFNVLPPGATDLVAPVGRRMQGGIKTAFFDQNLVLSGKWYKIRHGTPIGTRRPIRSIELRYFQ